MQDVIGDALGDPTRRIAVWDPDAATYVGVGGDPVALPRDGAERRVTYITRDGWPVAALIHDRALQTDSDIVGALTVTSLTLLENWRLVKKLRKSRLRLIKAADLERCRLERDLHDGAQQRLLAIQLKVAMAQEATDPQDRERQLNGIERGAEAAVEQLRRLFALTTVASGWHKTTPRRESASSICATVSRLWEVHSRSTPRGLWHLSIRDGADPRSRVT